MWEILKMGFTVASIGIMTVFVILVILIYAIKLLSVIINGVGRKNEKDNTCAVENEQVPELVVKDNYAATVAAITAGIYSVLSSESDNLVATEFVIRKIRQIKR